MGFTKSSAPVTSSDRNDRELCEDDGTADGGGNFLGAFDTETDVSLRVTNGNECLEASALAGTGLLLDGHDFHNLVLEFGKEKVDDLILFDRKGKEVDLLHGFDFTILHETTQLGDGDPNAVVVNEGMVEDGGEGAHHSFSSSLRPPRRGPLRPRPRSPRPRPNPPRPRAASAIFEVEEESGTGSAQGHPKIRWAIHQGRTGKCRSEECTRL